MLTMGPHVAELEARARARLRRRARRRGLVGNGGAASRGARARARAAATRCSSPRTPSRRPRTSSRSRALRPVLVDVDPETMNLDPARLDGRAAHEGDARGASLRPRRRGSRSCPTCRLLEDAAGALGARWRGTRVRRLGTMGCLSFHPRKIVTTGEGGAVTTDDARARRRDPAPRNHGWRSPADGDMPAPGLNYRLSDILCAIGIPQLRRLDELLAARTRIAAGYASGSRDLPVVAPGRRRGRRPRLAGVRDPVDRRDEALAGLRARASRRRSAPLRSTCLAAYRDQGPFPGAEPPSSTRSRCRSTRGSTESSSTGWRALRLTTSVLNKCLSYLPMSTNDPPDRRRTSGARTVLTAAASAQFAPQGPPTARQRT